ncbi:HEAT repeat domain-containing protein [Crossiella sp. NPDC003009]
MLRKIEELGWPLTRTRYDEDRSFELGWTVGGETEFCYVEDLSSGVRCCFLRGTDRTRFDELFNLVRTLLDVWTMTELVDEVRKDLPPMELVTAVFQLGLGAPTGYSEDYFAVLSESLAHPNPMIRAAAVRTMAYTEWPELRDALVFVAESDSDTRVVDEARLVLRAFDEVGDPNT